MDFNYMLHHEQDAEHLFSLEEWKKAIRKAEQRGYENGIRDEQIRAEKEKRKHNKQRIETFLFILLFIIITFAAWGVYTVIKALFELAGERWFWRVLFAYAIFIIKACAGNKDLLKDTRENMGVFQKFLSGTKKLCKSIRKNIKKNDKLFALSIICLGCLIGGAIGKFEVVSRTVSAAEAFGKTWISYDSQKKEVNHDGKAAEESMQMNESTEMKPSEEPNDSDRLDGNSDIAAFIEKSYYDVDDLRQIEISDIELDHIVDLSSEEYEFVFFTGEEYVIEDWEDQEEIDDAVLEMIKDLRREKKVNLFDGGIAPQDVQNEINYASEDEKKAKSFMEIERIQQVRVDVYRDYPKKSIANLVGNSEQLKALVLYYYRGRQQSILYHYGKSILWESEYLKYEDVSNDVASKHLSKIAQRYGDIAFVCKDCSESARAERLQTAYENAADWYRGVTDEEDR